MHGRRIAALAAAGCVVLSGCAVASSTADPARHANTSMAADTLPDNGIQNAAYTGTMKPYVLGNASRSLGAISGKTAALSARVNAVVVSVDWRSIETSQGAYNDSIIDGQVSSAQRRASPSGCA